MPKGHVSGCHCPCQRSSVGGTGAHSSLSHLECRLAVVVANLFARTTEEENPSTALLGKQGGNRKSLISTVDWWQQRSKPHSFIALRNPPLARARNIKGSRIPMNWLPLAPSWPIPSTCVPAIGAATIVKPKSKTTRMRHSDHYTFPRIAIS